MTQQEPLALKTALYVGVVLILVGLAASILTAFAHWTSMIPAIFGILLVLLGLWGKGDGPVRVATWGIGIVGLLGALGSVRAFAAWLSLFQGEGINLIATLAQTVMLVAGVVLAVVAARDLFAKE